VQRFRVTAGPADLGRHPPRGRPALLPSLTPGCPARPGYPDPRDHL